jgi:hypothetical protein
MHMLMCIVMSAAVIAFYQAIWIVCLHDVSMIRIGVESAHQEEEEPSHHHVAPGVSLPHKPSQHSLSFHHLPPPSSASRCFGLAVFFTPRTR